MGWVSDDSMHNSIHNSIHSCMHINMQNNMHNGTSERPRTKAVEDGW